MPRIDMTFRHDLPQEEALRRIKRLLTDVQARFADKVSDVRERWNGSVGKFSFSVMGFSTNGELVVGPSTVLLTGKLPPLATFFRGKIESVILEQATALLRP